LNELKGSLAAAVRGMDASGARYAVIGGISAIVRGALRLTMDIDVLALESSTDLERLRDALKAEAFVSSREEAIQIGEISLLRFQRPHEVVYVDVGLDVQIGASEFCQQVVSRATMEDYLGIQLPVATREDIVLLKLLAFRPLDRGDMLDIVEGTPVPLEWPYLESWADQLGVRGRLEEIRAAAAHPLPPHPLPPHPLPPHPLPPHPLNRQGSVREDCEGAAHEPVDPRRRDEIPGDQPPR